MTKMTGFVFKLLWLVLRLVSWLLGIFLRLTVGLVWRQTLGRSDVYVRRDWDDRGLGRVRWPDLHDPRWDTMSGGAQVENPLPLIHAYVWCDKVRGRIGHSCAHGAGPHNIKVCMLREDNTRRVWGRLLALVGPDRRLEPR
ncbi:MAG: hypothetical protein DSY78_14545 [Chloroflexi bacterium]|jgi:hypothetical protein|nr:MAG: hypothetical protein BZY84_05595 [SAR202 cluster bacterium MP-SInd-SRR3963457-G1]PKB85485.1 MAG: hypothetical protein BZY86_02375 [SAR202 cluster bacterium MP-NPac-SRR3961935-G1]RUA28846.1 MAG: hypothetical protein DSY78_14545 [Chloroflexota bacterium]